MRTHQNTTDTKTAIGTVRVSTQEQATAGVRLDAQRDRLRAYCTVHAMKRIDVKPNFRQLLRGIESWHTPAGR